MLGRATPQAQLQLASTLPSSVVQGKDGGCTKVRRAHATLQAAASTSRTQPKMRTVGGFRVRLVICSSDNRISRQSRDSRQSVSFSCLHALMFEGFVHTRACWAAQFAGPFLSAPTCSRPFSQWAASKAAARSSASAGGSASSSSAASSMVGIVLRAAAFIASMFALRRRSRRRAWYSRPMRA